jgi:hypothetical protein
VKNVKRKSMAGKKCHDIHMYKVGERRVFLWSNNNLRAQKSILVKQQQSIGSEEHSCEATTIYSLSRAFLWSNNNLLAQKSTLVKQTTICWLGPWVLLWSNNNNLLAQTLSILVKQQQCEKKSLRNLHMYEYLVEKESSGRGGVV